MFRRYIDNVFKKLNHLQTLSQKVIAKSIDLEQKRSDLLTDLSAVGPQTVALIRQTKSLQQRVCIIIKSFCLFIRCSDFNFF